MVEVCVSVWGVKSKGGNFSGTIRNWLAVVFG